MKAEPVTAPAWPAEPAPVTDEENDAPQAIVHRDPPDDGKE